MTVEQVQLVAKLQNELNLSEGQLMGFAQLYGDRGCCTRSVGDLSPEAAEDLISELYRVRDRLREAEEVR